MSKPTTVPVWLPIKAIHEIDVVRGAVPRSRFVRSLIESSMNDEKAVRRALSGDE